MLRLLKIVKKILISGLFTENFGLSAYLSNCRAQVDP